MRRTYFILSFTDFFLLSFQQGRIRTFDITACYLQPSFITDKLDTLSILIIFPIRLFGHHNTVSIFHGCIFLSVITSRSKFYRTGTVHTDSSLSDVKHMGTPVGRKAITGFLIPTPGSPQLFVLLRIERDRRTKIRMIVYLRIIQRSHPLIEVQISRHRHFRQIQRFWRCTDTGIYFLYMTDRSITNQLDRFLKLFARTLLASHL